MSPQHHPSSDILAAYAAGTLEPGFGLVAAAHLETCRACRTHVRGFEAVSGAALEALPAADIGAGALANVMARLEPSLAKIEIDRRPFLQRLPLRRRKWVAPGVWVAAVDTPHAEGNRVYVLSVAPGMPTARHQHDGAEFCTVLQGAFRDDEGLFEAGDFTAAYDDRDHQPVVVGDQPCVCLFATEGRLKARGVLGRLAFAYANV